MVPLLLTVASAPQPPLGQRRVVFFSGMYGSEVAEVIAAYRESGEVFLGGSLKQLMTMVLAKGHDALSAADVPHIFISTCRCMRC